ncbi:MAG: 16S rRNA (guanine(966)-N(2))-methyltransferase RsmD [Betaproteobacteria bacterium]|nr:16S rRNA (guanine(966)-N(2))-methyltransferase RsmD [Betaproteobacteria bacterium]
MTSPRCLPRKRPAGRIRIIAGTWRSRLIEVLDRPDLRPTPNRVRETLFNWLGQDLTGAACLDLYAGSGALGFEAASRGAASVVMVEADPAALRVLEKNRLALDARQVELVAANALSYLDRPHLEQRFDLVFLDPPFRQNVLAEILRKLPRCLARVALVYIEAPAPQPTQMPWTEMKRARAGEVHYQLLRWEGDDQSRISGNV